MTFVIIAGSAPAFKADEAAADQPVVADVNTTEQENQPPEQPELVVPETPEEDPVVSVPEEIIEEPVEEPKPEEPQDNSGEEPESKPEEPAGENQTEQPATESVPESQEIGSLSDESSEEITGGMLESNEDLMADERLADMAMMDAAAFGLDTLYDGYQHVNVGDFDSLKKVISGLDYRATGPKLYINLTNNIWIPTNYLDNPGIVVSEKFTHIVMDGAYSVPGQPNEIGRYDISGGTPIRLEDTIRIMPTNNVIKYFEQKNLTTKNGYNFFGIVHLDLLSTNNMDMVFDNVDYTGRQLVNAVAANVYINNCNVTITDIGGHHGEEIAEAHRVYLSGNVVLDKRQANSVMEMLWLWRVAPGRGLVRIEDNADVKVYTGLKYGTTHWNWFIYGDNAFDFEIGKNANFELYTDRGFTENLSVYDKLTNFTVGDGSSFKMVVNSLYHRNAEQTAFLYLLGDFYVGKGSTFIIESKDLTKSPVSGATYSCIGSGPAIKMASKNSSILINDPQLMIATGKSVTRFIETSNSLTPVNFLFKAQQMNGWQGNSQTGNVMADGNYFLDKKLGTNLLAERWVSYSQESTFTMNGVVTKDLAKIQSFRGVMKKDAFGNGLRGDLYFNKYDGATGGLVCIGRHKLETNPEKYVYPDPVYNGGTTEPKADVWISYKDFNDKKREIKGTANASGEIGIVLPQDNLQKISPFNKFEMISQRPYLFWEVEDQAKQGALELTIQPLEYGTHALSALPQSIYVQDNPQKPSESWKLEVLDSRGPLPNYTPWKLSVKMTKKLTSSSGDVLNNVVKFNDGKMAKDIALDGEDFNRNIELLFGKNTWNYKNSFEWKKKDKAGFRLEIPTGAAYSKKYEGTVVWTLVDSL